MPTVDAFYLIELFYDVGLAVSGENITPLGFGDISSFLTATRISLNPSEVSAIKKMSEHYVSWIYKGKKLDCNAPYFRDARTIEQQRAETSNKFKALGRKHGN